VILASGAFDGFHSGHLAYLREAGALDPSQPLVVAVAPDAYIERHKHRPARWPQTDRADVVSAVRGVTRVVSHAEPSIASVIRLLRPTYVVKGLDWLHTIPPDVAAACVETGATLTFVDAERTHGSAVAW
jgi:D-beta-D-heptose 7-phosphate kinase/D-beta-D-heptose 1-phosphate adenosyltransferase